MDIFVRGYLIFVKNLMNLSDLFILVLFFEIYHEECKIPVPRCLELACGQYRCFWGFEQREWCGHWHQWQWEEGNEGGKDQAERSIPHILCHPYPRVPCQRVN